MLSRNALIACSLAIFSSACAHRGQRKLGLELEYLHHTQEEPGNIALYFAVRNRDGVPVSGLTGEQFAIYEDGRLISQFEAKHAIVSPLPAMSHTLVLVDLSSSVVQQEYLAQVESAIDAFTQRAAPTNQVAVYAFDGSTELIRVSDFLTLPESMGSKIAGTKQSDPSTNLHGAVISSIQVLEEAISKAEQPLRFGTLVIISDGADRAGWTSDYAMMNAIERSGINVVAVGVGAEIDREQIARLARGGAVVVQPGQSVAGQFDEIFARIERAAGAIYQLVYCTPARAGHHQLLVEATGPDGSRGDLERGFGADGFGPGCELENFKPVANGLGKVQMW